ncbi:molybdate transport system permease protein [Rhodothalassium salexigens DSM 2132]|uniref:Molybdenum transport system permease n=2 Tax=Rhodothalassium salexigens TaxID=1086 RepID=A0A4R2PIN8_RHOSA|nr:molybdate ABC transporter permease subunit [Rhodothalassium salexigens]MBB4211409.1 molybdate transport system permease protein [Rhodothalassium salexigens DSM 2132]TCP35330.1 molybdate transport system permease protein [Rhodothalassium salexigens DSM 2132]
MIWATGLGAASAMPAVSGMLLSGSGEAAAGPVGLTMLLAAVTTAVLLVLATPIAWWLATRRTRWRPLVEALVALPLVLPPTVLGFYLLLAFAPTAPLGELWVSLTGQTLTFSFQGLVVASVLYSLPFAVQPLQAAFAAVGRAPLEAAATLGAGPWGVFQRVVLPQARRGYLVAGVLSFAHTVGEFGGVLMVGGNIPGETRLVSIALYEHVATLDYAAAHRLAAGLLVFSFAVLVATYAVERRTGPGLGAGAGAVRPGRQ